MIKVGDRVDSIYGREHRGVVTEVGEFHDGRPMLRVRRDSDGFVWIGWPEVVARVESCQDCKHWTPPTERDDFHNLWRGDKADPLYGRCNAIVLADGYERPPDPLPLAATKDGSDYKAELYTRPEFGCVMFEQKEIR